MLFSCLLTGAGTHNINYPSNSSPEMNAEENVNKNLSSGCKTVS